MGKVDVVGLQAGSVDHLVVDDQLATTIVDDQGADAATAILEGLADAAEQVTLGHHGQTLLDITGLGHGDQAAVITEVQDAVGLVDRAEHGLDHDGRRGVGDEAGLLLEFTGEQVDTQVAVLAGLGGDRDADHLAGTALKDQDVADADEVAGDRHGLGGRGAATGTGLNDTDILADAFTETNWTAFVSDDYVLAVVVTVRVHDAVGSALHTTTEGVIVTVVVVVTHLARRRGINDSLGLENLHRVRAARRLGNRLNVLLTAAVGVAGVGVDRLRLVSTVVRDVKLGLLELAVVRNVPRLLARTREGIYRSLRAAVVRRGRNVVGRIINPTTILALSDVKLVLESLIVGGLTVLETDRRFTITMDASEKRN